MNQRTHANVFFCSVTQGEDGTDYVVGLTPHGIVVLKGDKKIGFHIW